MLATGYGNNGILEWKKSALLMRKISDFLPQLWHRPCDMASLLSSKGEENHLPCSSDFMSFDY